MSNQATLPIPNLPGTVRAQDSWIHVSTLPLDNSTHLGNVYGLFSVAERWF